MKILRLLLTEACNRSCKGCCNNDWDLAGLDVARDFTGYDQILLTGGEPMLDPNMVIDAIINIRQQTDALIYLYTAWTRDIVSLLRILSIVDGLTVTLHNQGDVAPFLKFHSCLISSRFYNESKSYRLNVFREVKLRAEAYHPFHNNPIWKIKDDMVWIKDCPLPPHEVLQRYERYEG